MGEHDCCLFAADCALAVCGIDIAEKVRGRYKTKSGAMRVLKSEFGDLESGLSSFFIEIEPDKATRGDIVMFHGDEGKLLGCFGLARCGLSLKTGYYLLTINQSRHGGSSRWVKLFQISFRRV